MNLLLGQAAWTQLFRELGVYLKPIKLLRETARRFDDALSRVQVVDNNGSASLLSGWVVVGAKYGVNTDENGKLFPRVAKDSIATTIAAGSNTVNVNTFAGAGTLHAASSSGFPTSGTLTVATGSGNQVVSYTGVSGNDFTGCSSSGAGVMSTGGAISVSTVSLYTATGAGGLVAQGIGAYPLASLALTAQNSSGLSATVVVGSLSGSEAVDTHYLTVFIDFIAVSRAVFDGSQPEHGSLASDYRDALVATKAALVAQIDALQTVMTTFLGTRVRRTIGSGHLELINLATSSTPTGAITTDYSGVLEDLRADMADETSPAAQTILRSLLAAAGAVFAVTNDGQATLSGPSLTEFAHPGVITGTCVESTFGKEQFALSQAVTRTNSVLSAADVLTIDQAYASPDLGIAAMTLKRLLTLSSGSANDFGSMGSWILTGLASGNVDSNQRLYPKVIAGVIDPSKWIQQLYSASSRTSASLVAQSDEAASSATGVLLTEQNGSGLAGVVAIGSAPTAAHAGTIACNGFQKQNSSKNVADSWTVTISQTSVGEIQDLVRVLLSYQLNSASSSPTIPDGFAAAGTYVPFVVRDADP